MSVSRDDVQKIAQLARLAFTPEEEAQLTGDLNRMLEYVATLDQLDTTGVPPTAHVLPMENAFRDDVTRPSLNRADALGNAPLAGQGHFRVPKVIES